MTPSALINDEFRRLIIAALMNKARQQGSLNPILLDRACEQITQEECDGKMGTGT